VFELYPKSTYIEINNVSVNAVVDKKTDEIIIQTNCFPGELAIKETYDDFWKGTINGKALNLKQNSYSFMKAYTDETGSCEIKLKFEIPIYYSIINMISIFGWIISIIFLILSYSNFWSYITKPPK
jgi:uncharacterized membrane protein YfhO